MKPKLGWEDAWTEKIAGLQTTLTTGRQFSEMVRELVSMPDCPLKGLRFDVTGEVPFGNQGFGFACNCEDDGHTVESIDSRHGKCRIHAWYRAGVDVPPSLAKMVSELFAAFWKTECRTPSAGMIDAKRDESVVTAAARTVRELRENGRLCSVCFFDLDGFGAVNKVMGQNQGDRIILEFGAVLEQSATDHGSILHSGGDEFVVLLPGAGGSEAVAIVHQIAKAIRDHDFKSDKLPIGASFGIASTDVDGMDLSYAELESLADRALKEYAKKPNKGVARFNAPDDPSKDDKHPLSAFDLDLALCLCKSNLTCPDPFSSVWLNAISRTACHAAMQSEGNLKDVGSAICELQHWLGLRATAAVGTELGEGHNGSPEVSPVLSTLLCGFAVAHGILRAAIETGGSRIQNQSLSLTYDNEGLNVLLAASEDRCIWSSGSLPDNVTTYDIGAACILAENVHTSVVHSSAAVLVKIGHKELPYPKSLFAEIIVVDDRPTRGGGLPDFWEATLARLVSHVLATPDSLCVYAVGDPDHGAETFRRLAEASEWSAKAEELAYRTGLTAANIRDAAKLLANKVSFPSSKEDLVARLAVALRPYRTLIGPRNDSQRQPAFLKRALPSDAFSLHQHDGCRVRTLAEAYPVVLEICRQQQDQPIRDQAGLDLTELIDFRVHLTEPSAEMIPAFYEKEQSSLEAYFAHVFTEENSLFGQVFSTSGQLEAVLDHIVSTIQKKDDRFSTRRAVLVIPHAIKDGSDVAPLGLISVRLLPRFTNGNVIIGFSFTWRTVEALVGFPYSLYGSVRFGQHLVDAIKRALPEGIGRTVKMGEVSYVAHSLHMFADRHGQNIARKIVNDASL